MTSVSFNVTIKNNNIPEDDETFYLSINASSLPNVHSSTEQVEVTIVNTDSEYIIPMPYSNVLPSKCLCKWYTFIGST